MRLYKYLFSLAMAGSLSCCSPSAAPPNEIFPVGEVSVVSTMDDVGQDGAGVNDRYSASDIVGITWHRGRVENGIQFLDSTAEEQNFLKWANAHEAGWKPLIGSFMPAMVFLGKDFRFDFHKDEGMVLRTVRAQDSVSAHYLKTDLMNLSFVNPEEYLLLESHVQSHHEGFDCSSCRYVENPDGSGKRTRVSFTPLEVHGGPRKDD